MKKIIGFVGTATAVASMAFAGNALAYQSNTGAGSINQPRIQQNYQRPPAQSYYQQAPAPRQQIQTMPNPTGIPGMPPVVTSMPRSQPSDPTQGWLYKNLAPYEPYFKSGERFGQGAMRCGVGGAALAFGGPVGAGVGCISGVMIR